MKIDREVVFSCTISTDVAHPPSELQNNILSATRADQASAPSREIAGQRLRRGYGTLQAASSPRASAAAAGTGMRDSPLGGGGPVEGP